MGASVKGAPDTPQISPLVNHILVSLKDLVSNLITNESQRSVLDSHLARFKLWAGNLGAHRTSGGRSLDYRLRDAPALRNHVINLLKQLETAVQEANDVANGDLRSSVKVQDAVDQELAEYLLDESDTEGSDLDEVLYDIGHVTDCLMRLSVTLSRPIPNDRYKSRELNTTLMFYQEFDIKHIREKFPAMDFELAKRLGIAMVERRHFLKYREEHHNKLSSGIDGDVEDTDLTTVATSVPGHMKDADFRLKPNSDAYSEASTTSTSYADSIDNAIPPAPSGYADGPVLCPLCYSIIEIVCENDWRKHVYRDLQPYVCLALHCSTRQIRFRRRTDWALHMRDRHWRIWRCSLGCSCPFNTGEEFQSHLHEKHANAILAEHHSTFEGMCSDIDLSKANGPCPLCGIVFLNSAVEYYKHVGGHLEQLSLFVLPQQTDDIQSVQPESTDLNRQNELEKNDITMEMDDSMEIRQPMNTRPDQTAMPPDVTTRDSSLRSEAPSIASTPAEDPGSPPTENAPEILQSLQKIMTNITVGDSQLKDAKESDPDGEDSALGNYSSKQSIPQYQTDRGKFRWNCCNCGACNNSYVYDTLCPDCGHRQDVSCQVWATKY
ncbi:hypothetical protein F5Y16DRAFT_361186 [Xylariaceae sp. FL0255]|nr:hypothetical protein F5Y16DRAFT_361186 [Xylariaceae sp. FL0255]